MLPFMKPKAQAGILTTYRKSDSEEPQAPTDQELYSETEGIAEDIMRAINMKDAKALAEAMKDMFDVLDSQPHEEGPHLNESEGDE